MCKCQWTNRTKFILNVLFNMILLGVMVFLIHLNAIYWNIMVFLFKKLIKFPAKNCLFFDILYTRVQLTHKQTFICKNTYFLVDFCWFLGDTCHLFGMWFKIHKHIILSDGKNCYWYKKVHHRILSVSDTIYNVDLTLDWKVILFCELKQWSETVFVIIQEHLVQFT